MDKLTALFLQFLPKQVAAIKLLQYVPNAIDTAKELTAFVQRTITALKQEGVLTPEQDAELDKAIEELKTQPHWQPETP